MYIIRMCTYCRNKIELPYLKIKTPEGISHGGSQSWFGRQGKGRRESVLSDYGCGLVSLGDFFWVAGEQYPELKPSLENGCYRPAYRTEGLLEEKQYLGYLESLRRKYLWILPRLGANAWQIWAAAWRYMRKSGYMAKLHWGVPTWRLKQRILSMLEQGLPVIFCVGPNLNPFDREQKVTLYQPEGAGMKAVTKVRAHYMNITGMLWDREGKCYLQVSSWGKCYYISWQEYLHYRRSQPPLLGSWLSNILYVKF